MEEALKMVLMETYRYYSALWYYFRGGKFSECTVFEGLADGKRMNLHVFSLCLALRLWHVRLVH